ncbi:phospholipase A [Leeuwenhoekiella marinoflava]|uniref:phospholipase A n=1 Tax=Leeuwenhoekiella marinoflava TaxID=988 RepID=UPI0030015A75|tara:strand:- start:31 stop:888 length:858 start_codon:yes stop_codon:yes gene_type:complete
MQHRIYESYQQLLKSSAIFNFIFFTIIFCNQVQAQRLSREQLKDTVIPSFSIYKDTYFITGIPTHTGISDETADVKYQISFKQLITRYSLPFDSQLFLTYTQKAFWNVYEFSSPFQEVNFNPGIGLGRPIFDKDDKLMGLTELKLEHESNGRDSIYSRSWNSLSFSYHTRVNDKFLLGVKAWVPFAYKDNTDLINYIGYGELNLNYDINKDFILDVQARKGNKWDLKGSIRTRLTYKISRSTNQHIMLEWFNGYGESLIAFDQHRSMIRIGYIIKSPDLDILKIN